ncbi:hypothetical protein VTH82DRAFT_3455 [Thermothelomyces myriococcoides]
MAWWDSHHRLLDGSSRSKTRLIMGDAFPRLESAAAAAAARADRHADIERERALLSPVLEEQSAPPTTPALVVHVDIRFTDPVIRSRYYRSYGSSPGFQVTNRICRGLVRRIERCSEELITRKDSGALDVFKGDTFERKPQRFEMTFRLTRRGMGDWAERTYRSYQKEPLTVGHTKEVTLAVHRMIGLFLRRHDKDFRWLDSPVPEADLDQSESASPSLGGWPRSLLSVPTSRFIEATQTYESLPGYSIDLYFRSRNPQRSVPSFERRTKVMSTQTAPLTLLMGEDLLWRVLQFANQGLDARKRELDDYRPDCRLPDHVHPQNDTLELSIRVVNHLGPAHDPVEKSIRSRLVLFQHPEARDCESFFCELERYLSHARDEADAILNGLNDFELRIVELKGVGWTLREPAKFAIGPEASYGRRTIRAALDRIQTGVGDVIRGHNIAIHIAAYKRGHLVLDKAIVAHEKRGRPRETFASHEDEQEVFVRRLRARVQNDLDKVFEDSCSIDDIPEDEDDYFSARPITPQLPESAVIDEPPRGSSPSSVRSSPVRRPAPSGLQASPHRPRSQRVFSLSRRSTESVRSVDNLTAVRNGSLHSSGSRPSSVASELAPPSPPEQGQPESPLPNDGRDRLLAPAEIKPTRAFSLVSRRSFTGERASNTTPTLGKDQAVGADGSGLQTTTTVTVPELQLPKEHPDSVQSVEPMTSSSDERSRPAHTPLGISSGDVMPVAISVTPAADQQADAQSTENKHIPPISRPRTPVHAEENVGYPMAECDLNPGLVGASTGSPSSQSDDYLSTAPSTPGLSTGTSSPRHSLLITPGDKEVIFQHTYPEFEPESDVIRLYPETGAEPICKEVGNNLAPDQSLFFPLASPQPATDQNPIAEEPRHAPVNAGIRLVIDNEVPDNPEPSAAEQQRQQQNQQAKVEELAVKVNAGRGLDSVEKPDHLGDGASVKTSVSYIVNNDDSTKIIGAEIETAPDLKEVSTGDKLGAPNQDPVICTSELKEEAKELETGKVAEAGSPAETPSLAEHAAVETPTPETAPSSLAPNPDASPLYNLSPVPTRFSISSSATTNSSRSSIKSIPVFRNSVDTIRLSTEESRRSVSAEQPSSQDSRPKTAGYLGVGLGRGPRSFFEVGLRGALGDVATRQRRPVPDGDSREKLRPRAPASDAGGDDADGDEQSGLPRMMLLLAGVVAVGKIVKKVAE